MTNKEALEKIIADYKFKEKASLELYERQKEFLGL